jgi:hypothetical protein
MSEPVELDQAARDLIAAGREGAAPNDFVAERLRRSVDRVLRGSAPPARSRSRLVPIFVTLGAAALGGALYASQQATRREPTPTLEPAPPAKPVSKAQPIALPTAAAPAPEPSAFVPALPAANDVAAPAPTSDRTERPSRSQNLSAEIEHLARVNAAVNAGDGRRALELLTEYDRKFRPSILAEERAAASVLALCAAGRTAEARAAAERFTRTWPRSPLRGRISGSCAGAR